MMAAQRPDFLEPHYTIPQLAKQWQVGQKILRSYFRNCDGVIKLGEGKLVRGRKKPYVSLRIPESVARRVYREITSGKVYPTDAS